MELIGVCHFARASQVCIFQTTFSRDQYKSRHLPQKSQGSWSMFNYQQRPQDKTRCPGTSSPGTSQDILKTSSGTTVVHKRLEN